MCLIFPNFTIRENRIYFYSYLLYYPKFLLLRLTFISGVDSNYLCKRLSHHLLLLNCLLATSRIKKCKYVILRMN